MNEHFPKIIAGSILAFILYSITEDFYNGFKIFNGVHFIFTISNGIICVILFITLLVNKVRKYLVNALLIIFILICLLKLPGNYLSSMLFNVPGNLFTGDHWFLIGEMCLFTIIYYTKKFPGRANNNSLLDDQTDLNDPE